MDELHFSFDFCILGLQFACLKQAGVFPTALLSGMFFVNYTEFISIARNRLIPNTACSSYRRKTHQRHLGLQRCRASIDVFQTFADGVPTIGSLNPFSAGLRERLAPLAVIHELHHLRCEGCRRIRHE